MRLSNIMIPKLLEKKLKTKNDFQDVLTQVNLLLNKFNQTYVSEDIKSLYDAAFSIIMGIYYKSSQLKALHGNVAASALPHAY